ncbi:hypothetical protein DYB31_005682 [Aphanomyces astaci]|uniref:Uncharacterized protein n=1 Tax=Aphanomyces astaci TaxID=112090 RepID=A0A397F4X2_APHAT|nr:hypothetical protein DYB31_005682 [Aphanomyces astaci]
MSSDASSSSDESSDNEPLGYFELVTQLRQVYQFVKSEEQPVDMMPSFVSRTCVTGRWRRVQAPTQSSASWLFRVLGSFILLHWTLVETPSELLMKFDESLIPTLTPYLLNGDPMFLSFSPIGMSTGGMQGRAMAGNKILKSFSELNLSERINFPGEWRVIWEEDSTFVRIKD